MSLSPQASGEPIRLREGAHELELQLCVSERGASLSLSGLSQEGEHYSAQSAGRLISLLPQPVSVSQSQAQDELGAPNDAQDEQGAPDRALEQLALKLLPELAVRPLEVQLWALERLALSAELIALSIDASLSLQSELSGERLEELGLTRLVHEGSSLLQAPTRCLVELKTLQSAARERRLSVEFWLEPFGASGPKLRVAEGAQRSLHKLTNEAGDVRLYGLNRDFEHELAFIDAAMSALGLLNEPGALRSHELELSLEEGLELVKTLGRLSAPDSDPKRPLELALETELGPVSLRAVWPNRDAWVVTEQLDERSLSVNIRKVRGGGMSLSGSLNLGRYGSAKLRDVSSLLLDSPSQYVQLPSGTFLSLTQEFLEKLQALELSAPDGKASPATASVIDELTAAQAQVKASQAWLDSVASMRAAENLAVELPSGLQATLRSYQREGFEWMSRLATWGGGACLADDMGLGKTIQGLTVALSRPEGPTLVVAPTSVCGAWVDEAARFAPSLTVTRFGFGAVSSAGARRRALSALKGSDLVVCSYGLLGSEREALGAIHWRTIILDEAQAIKTPSSLRHRAAIELNGDFKVAMTGTPIENHLRDLWSLMRFLNPGLLGDAKRFRSTFEGPIEQGGELGELRSAQLKQLVAPFTLRRTKREVLQELPSKTELNLTVTLSDAEAAQYVALKELAMGEVRERLKQSSGGIAPHVFKVLTKLRLACCHPSLVNEDWSGQSAKFEHFKRIVTQLKEGGHKALVFSQFVKHLDILEAWVREEGLSYERLDGSTPAEQRDRSVERFQQGGVDLFLISLRAGGVGLTLTEADYVIHMDPWWNPAVEDQATNRAHRIGQDKPVTLYRLITQGTIEERILALHQHKRNLADQVLDGAKGESAVGIDEWLKLLDLDSDGEPLAPEDALRIEESELNEWTEL